MKDISEMEATPESLAKAAVFLTKAVIQGTLDPGRAKLGMVGIKNASGNIRLALDIATFQAKFGMSFGFPAYQQQEDQTVETRQ